MSIFPVTCASLVPLLLCISLNAFTWERFDIACEGVKPDTSQRTAELREWESEWKWGTFAVRIEAEASASLNATVERICNVTWMSRFWGQSLRTWENSQVWLETITYKWDNVRMPFSLLKALEPAAEPADRYKRTLSFMFKELKPHYNKHIKALAFIITHWLHTSKCLTLWLWWKE